MAGFCGHNTTQCSQRRGLSAGAFSAPPPRRDDDVGPRHRDNIPGTVLIAVALRQARVHAPESGLCSRKPIS